MNLNKYQSTYIDQPGMYEVTITEAKNDYTRSGKECVFVRLETEKNQAITCSYVEAVYFKLFRLAQAAGLTESQRANFEPDMLVGKRVKINVISDDNGRVNVGEVYSASVSDAASKSYEVMPF
jgi:hypothetical protein